MLRGVIRLRHLFLGKQTENQSWHLMNPDPQFKLSSWHSPGAVPKQHTPDTATMDVCIFLLKPESPGGALTQ